MSESLPKQSLPTDPGPTLDRLPSIVLGNLARILASRLQPADDTVLRLALAAPVFYAPCLRAVIRTTTAYSFDINVSLDSNEEPTLVQLSTRQVKKLVFANDTCRWYLVLALRDNNRVLLQPSDSKLVEASSRWSLLPVPLWQVSRFCVYFSGMENGDSKLSIAIPPYCQVLGLRGRIPWQTLDLPLSLFRLHLWSDAVLPSWDVASQVVARFPRSLRFISINQTVRTRSCGDSLVTLLDLDSVTAQRVDLTFETSQPVTNVMLALARLVARSPSLTGLTLEGCKFLSGWDPLTFAALPRNGMHDLRLTFYLVASERPEDLTALDRLADGFPTTVETFSCEIDRPWNDPVMAASLHAFFGHIPLATSTLHMKLPIWDAVMGAALPLAPQLQTLTLENEPDDDPEPDLLAALVEIIPRIPATVTHLTLDAWPFGIDERAVTLLVQHLPPQLVSLSLQDSFLQNDHLERFTLPSTLTHLDLHGNRLTVGPTHLPHQLVYLDLSENLLDDKQPEWVHHLPLSLEELSLYENNVGDRVGMALHDYSKMATTLRAIDLTITDVSEKVVAILRTTVQHVICT
ncbi:hypothetical protein AMAG_12115 [Allomyces macrogynus ATCC 38327]|uniref:Uncharacterized protein n=1 Tax=Allomyces macrogynus (strain ATCC 38327) TaxID=578462 RepID=A0A0L0SWV9_ALLM3|nr:hypothetical protein AMAG_12115 [Allomyces macrogynus ATCC 38327]|eukprot:KNE67038.1 hypothetical protein AMAG_12115 [Allomyces macrogynus ATCC 38327]